MNHVMEEKNTFVWPAGVPAPRPDPRIPVYVMLDETNATKIAEVEFSTPPVGLGDVIDPGVPRI